MCWCENNGGNKMRKQEEEKRIIKRLLDVFEEASKDADARKGLEKRLDISQLKVMDDLLNNELDPEDRWIAYSQGFQASEIARATDFTRANISARIRHQLEGRKEEIDEKHKENREKLYYAREWYLYVYLSDLEGDFRQIGRYLPKLKRDDAYMYRMYKHYGGEDIERDFVDRRQILDDKRKKELLKELEFKTIEQVSFQERVYPETVRRIAEENNVDYVTEKEKGETEYTEKLHEWIKRKREQNIQDKRRRREREEAMENKDR